MISGRQVGSLFATLKLDRAQFEADIRHAGGAFGTLGTAAGNAAGVIKGAMTGAALAVSALAVVGIKNAVALEAAMSESLAIMGDVSEDMRARMTRAARDVALETTFSAKEAADAYFFLASAGLDAAASIEALPFVAKFAQAGAFDLAKATDLLTDAQSALGLSSKDAAENLKNMALVGDTLVRANTLANASVEQFSAALTNKAAVTMRKYNIELAEGVAVLATFADAGVKGEKAGNTFTAMIEGLGKAAERKSAAFEKFGLEIYDASGQLLPMTELIANLTHVFSGMTDQQKAAAFQQMGINRLTADGIGLVLDQTEKTEGYRDALAEVTGYTEDVATKQLDNLNAQWKLLKNAATDITITLGNALLPHLRKLVEGARDVATRIGEWLEKNKELVDSVFPVIAALGLLVSLGAGMGMLSRVMGPLGPMLGQLTMFAGPLLAILGPILLIVGLLAGAFLAFQYAVENNIAGMGTFQPVLDGLYKVFDALLGVLDPLVEWFGALFGVFSGGGIEATDRLEGATAALQDAFANLGAAVGELVDGIFGEGTWAGVEDVVGGALEGINNSVGWLVENVLPMFESAWRSLTEEVLPAFADGIGGLVDSVMPSIEGAIQWFAENVLPMLSDGFGWLADDVIPKVGEVLGWLAETILPLLGDAFSFLLDNVIMPLADFITATLVDVVFPALAGAMQFIEEQVLPPLRDGFNALMDNVLRPLWQNVLEPLATFIADNLGPALQFVADVILPPLKTAFDLLKGAIDLLLGVLRGVADFLGNVFNGAVEIATGVVDTFTGAFNDGTQAGKDWADAIKAGEKPVGRLADMIQKRGIVGLFEFGSAMSSTADEFSESGSWIQDVIDAIGQSIDTFVGNGKRLLDEIARFFDTNFAQPVGRSTDQVGGFIHGLLGDVQRVFGDIQRAIGGAVDAVRRPLEDMFRPLGDGINDALRVVKDAWNGFARFWNGITIKVPLIDVPFVGTFGGTTMGLPNLPTFAAGGTAWKDMLAMVGEAGPELAWLPAGARIYNAGQTRQMLDELAGGRAGGGRFVGIEKATIVNHPDEVERQVRRAMRRIAFEQQLSAGGTV